MCTSRFLKPGLSSAPEEAGISDPQRLLCRRHTCFLWTLNGTPLPDAPTEVAFLCSWWCQDLLRAGKKKQKTKKTGYGKDNLRKERQHRGKDCAQASLSSAASNLLSGPRWQLELPAQLAWGALLPPREGLAAAQLAAPAVPPGGSSAPLAGQPLCRRTPP